MLLAGPAGTVRVFINKFLNFIGISTPKWGRRQFEIITQTHMNLLRPKESQKTLLGENCKGPINPNAIQKPKP
jgi:hypothetical protein